MENDKSKFKKEVKKGLYNFGLKLIEFLDNLPKERLGNHFTFLFVILIFEF